MDSRAQHKSSVSRSQYLEELRLLFVMEGKVHVLKTSKLSDHRYAVSASMYT